MQAVRFIRDTDGARIAYAVVGEGPLVLCPAWWVSHVERDWEHPGFRSFFTRLADGFRVVRYDRSEEHTSELQSRVDLVCRLLLEKKKKKKKKNNKKDNIHNQ